MAHRAPLPHWLPPRQAARQRAHSSVLKAASRATLVAVLLCLLPGLLACTTATVTTTTGSYLERLQSQSRDDVTVATSILSPAETEAQFGIPLANKGIQPVWLEVDNRGEQALSLMLLSVDPDYFSPSEVAWMYRRHLNLQYDRIIERFLDQHIPVVIPPGETASGFVFTNLDPGAKAFSVELWAEGKHLSFDFAQMVPGFEADFTRVNFHTLYPETAYRELDLDGLRTYLEALPCCVMGPDLKTPGDPMNLVIVGDGRHMLATLVRQGWDLTETMRRDTVWKTVASSIFRSQYRTSPISPLYVFDRSQDISLQKTRGTVDERNHLRLWLAPVTHEGKSVWVGQISRDIGVKLSRKTLVTHKIDPIVDEARLYITLDLASSLSLRSLGYAYGVEPSTRDEPRVNYTRDPYYTDGLRAVLIMGDQQQPLDRVEFLDWIDPLTRQAAHAGDTAPQENK
jgi:LssY C-terminus